MPRRPRASHDRPDPRPSPSEPSPLQGEEPDDAATNKKTGRRSWRGKAPGPGESPVGMDPQLARPETTEPVGCPHFGRCGGCDFLDTPYAAELSRKEGRFRRLVERELGREVEVLPILPAEQPLFGRTSIKVPIAKGPGGVVAGFYQRGTQRIVDLKSCVVQDSRLTTMLRFARTTAKELHVPAYEVRRDSGLLRAFVARLGAGTDQMLAGLVVRRARHPKTRQLAEALFERFKDSGLVGVVENVNSDRDSAVMGSVTRTLFGQPRMAEEHRGLRSVTTLGSFAQTNRVQAEVLYAEILRALGDVEGRSIVDLFSGSGPIALRLALAGARVTAIERNAEAVRQGVNTVRKADLSDRVRFLTGDAGNSLHRLDTEGIDAVVVDPARRGLAPNLIGTLTHSMFPRLIYVSCNPVSLVRDLGVLSKAFQVRSLRPVDMFPRTEHLEIVAALERRTPEEPAPARRPSRGSSRPRKR